MIGYGFLIGLTSSLMGVSGGSVSNMIQTLYGKPLHNAVATSAGLGVPITDRRHHRPRAGGLAEDGAAAAVLDRLCVAARRRDHGAGVELHGAYGARLAHRLSKRQLEIGFGLFLLLVSARFVASLV